MRNEYPHFKVETNLMHNLKIWIEGNWFLAMGIFYALIILSVPIIFIIGNILGW